MGGDIGEDPAPRRTFTGSRVDPSRSRGEWKLGLWLLASAPVLAVTGFAAGLPVFAGLGGLVACVGLFIIWFDRPYLGLLILTLVSPLTFLSRQILANVLSVGFGLFSAVALVGVAAWTLAFSTGRVRLRNVRFVLAIASIFVVLAASLLVSHVDGDLADPGFSVRHLISFAGLLGAAVLFAEYVTSKDRAIHLAWVLVAALTGGAVLNLVAAIPSVGALLGVRAVTVTDRLAGLVGFANTAGFLGSTSIVLLVSLPTRRRHVRLLGSLVLLPPLLAALLMSGSRSSVLAGAAGMVILAFGRFPHRRAVITTGVLISVAVAVAMSTVHVGAVNRLHVLESLGNLRSGDLRRIEQYKITGEILERRPLLGVGWGNFQFVADRFLPPSVRSAPQLPPHSGILQMTAEGGILGLLAYLFLCVVVYSRARYSLRQFSDDRGARAIIAGLVVFVAFQLFQPGLSQEVGWVLMGLTVGLASSRQNVHRARLSDA